LTPLGDAFISVAVGFFHRGSSAMMTFLGLGFGVSILVLSGSLVILSPCFKSRPLIEAIQTFYYAADGDN
jgi:hypothetical protein